MRNASSQQMFTGVWLIIGAEDAVEKVRSRAGQLYGSPGKWMRKNQ